MNPSESINGPVVTVEEHDNGGNSSARHIASTLDVSFADAAPLIDNPAGLIITGCPPRTEVVIRTRVDDGGSGYEASGTFVSTDAGKIDTSASPSLRGTYEGIDPFGLWWSGELVAPSTGTQPPPAPMQCRLRLETSAGWAESVVERHWLAGGTTLTQVREPGVLGLLARPAGQGPFPAVVAFGGSGGGLGPAAGWAPILASHGIAVLAIAYFGAPGLPESLVGIEVETVERAARWLLGRDDVLAGMVAVMGMSRGSELAMLASVLVDQVGPVVAFAPSSISWAGLDAQGPVDAPAWTYRGQEIPYAHIGAAARMGPLPTNDPLALRPAFETALRDERAINHAEIPIERAKGPILMVSGQDDAMWPSTTMAAIAERRAAQHGAAAQVRHLRYPDAGHLCAGVPGLPVVTEVRHPLTGGFYSFGGTRAGNAAARADSWPQVLTFLRNTLPS
jgi:dienelactone hydrolase